MHRIDSDTVDEDLFGSGKDGYTEGDPGVGVPATATTADHLNAIQEEICGVIESAGITLNKADNTQLTTAIQTYSSDYLVLMAIANIERVGFSEQISGIDHAEDLSPGVGLNDVDRWIVVGDNGFISTSDDEGKTWTTQTQDDAYADDFKAVKRSGTVFVAVGETGEIQTGDDLGETWTHRTADAAYAGSFFCIEKLGSVWVIAGASGEIQTSSDSGATWTHRTAAASYSGTFRGAATKTGLYVLVGHSGAIQTSPDGTTWTSRTSGTSDDFYGVYWSSALSLFIAVGESGLIKTSPDGTTWTTRTSGTSVDLFGIGEFNGHYVACGDSRTIVWSKNATTWTEDARHGSTAGFMRTIGKRLLMTDLIGSNLLMTLKLEL